jgi:hypothetical protein
VRHRLAYGLTWLAATALATTIGLAATAAVGDVIRGTGPLGADVRSVPTTVPDGGPAPDVVRETFTLPEITLTGQCTGRTAELLAVEAGPGWTVTDEERGPDEDVDVVVTDGVRTTEVEIYCNQGRPQPVQDHGTRGAAG